MRLHYTDRETPVITLSKRNLEAGLHKLEMEGSARQLQGDGFILNFETDEEHYAEREEPPGAMHPETEQFIAERRA